MNKHYLLLVSLTSYHQEFSAKLQLLGKIEYAQLSSNQEQNAIQVPTHQKKLVYHQ